MWADWGPYSLCSETCGNSGKRSRRRHLTLKTAAELQDLGSFFEERAHVVQPDSDGSLARFLPQGLRLEILAAFACGLFGRAVFVLGFRAWERRGARAAGPSGAREALTPRRGAHDNLGGGSWGPQWPGGFFGWPSSAAARMGYLPVSQAPGAAETEA